MEALTPDPLEPEPRDGFRRNLFAVVTVHVALIGVLWLFGRGATATPPQGQITWLDGTALPGPSAQEPPEIAAPAPPEQKVPEPESEPTPEPEPETPNEPAPADPPPPTPEPEPIAKPEPTRAPTPKPKATPTPEPTPKPAAKATPRPKTRAVTSKAKSTPRSTPSVTKKFLTAKVAAKPASPPTESSSAGNNAKTASASPGTGSGRAGAPNGSATATERQTYFAAVGEEFRATWKLYKPLVAESSGGQLTALVHVKIGSSGSVVEAKLTRSTGNQEVDQSIRRALGDFKRVPAPPSTLLSGGQFESDIAVILSI